MRHDMELMVSNRIHLGGGAYLEPDDNPRDTRFHKKIRRIIKTIPNTKTGFMLELECGHRVMSFGNLAHANGVLYCVACRELEVTKASEQ